MCNTVAKTRTDHIRKNKNKKCPPPAEVAKPKVLVGGKAERAAGVAGKLGALLDFMSDRIAIAVCAYSQESRHC